MVIGTFLENLKSSTPDGLAPLSQTVVAIFAITISAISLLWAGANLFLLLRQAASEQNQEGTESLNTFTQFSRKILKAVLEFLKFNYIVSGVAGLIFFVVILGAIDNFENIKHSLVYLYGLISSITSGLAVAVISQMAVRRVSIAGMDSLQSVNWAAKTTSNFVAFFIPGLSILLISLILIVGQPEMQQIALEDVKQIGKQLFFFAFGVSTVAIGTKINSVLYGKSSEGGLSLIAELEPELERNHKNPAVICKAVGENVRKIVSNATDYNMYLCMSVACGVYSGGINIVGADQKGQIIFSLSNCNFYLAVIGVLFLLVISIFVNAVFSLLLKPTTGEQVALNLKREVYTIIILMSGFLALAAYLSLPVQFFLTELPGQIKGPHLAYAITLIALFLSVGLLLIAQIQANHPRAIYSVIFAGHESEASGILAGFELGWIGSALPMIVWAGVAYLAQWWLGSFGVALIALGNALLIPSYLGINTYYCLTENASFTIWVGGLGEEGLRNVMQINEGRNLFQSQVNSHFISVSVTANYALILSFISLYELKQIPLLNMGVFLGMIVGAMLIYSFGSIILLCIQKLIPIVYLDIRAQIEQNPGIRERNDEINQDRSSFVLCLNTIVHLRYFLPYLFLPFILIGLAFGPKMTLGIITGMIVSGLQLAFSSGLSGNIWNAARSEVFLGKAVSGEGQVLKPQTLQGKAVDLGNEVGMKIKDALGSCFHGYLSFTNLTNVVMGGIYCSLHT